MCRILIVDDDALFCHMLADRLRREVGKDKLIIEESNSAEAAQQMVQNATEPFDILLIDNRLGPGLSGIDLIENLHGNHARMDFVLFTGLDEPEIGLRAYMAGAHRYLVKPFEPSELIWIVKSLIQQRSADYERNWLRLLNEVAEKTQKAVSIAQVAEALVEGGLHLGFERARIYRVEQDEDGNQVLAGISQAGHCALHNFEQVRVPTADARYAKKVITEQDICFFDGAELGSGFRCEQFEMERFPLAVGEWAGIPLMSGDMCSGVFILDNDQQARRLTSDQRTFLRLFARQATAAFEHVHRHEEQQRKDLATEIVKRVNQQMGDATQPNNLERLLKAIQHEFDLVGRAANFIVVLVGDSPEWLYTRLHIENGEVRQPYWRQVSENSITVRLVSTAKPLFLPNGTEQYRQQYDLRQVGLRAARSWMGMPLKIGSQTIGAMIIEDDNHKNTYTRAHFELLREIADQLANFVQTAWLNERQEIFNKQLSLLQSASETIMVLAEQSEERLWHATLTLATASYGFRFNRAMLLLVEDGGTRLRGRIGIGHFMWEEAEREWKKIEADHQGFTGYLDRLRSNQLDSTPIDGTVRKMIIALDASNQPESAFAEVLHEGKVVVVPAEQTKVSLPPLFVEQFGVTDYALVPAKAGKRIVGIVVLDTIWGKEPQKFGALVYLGTLMNQAALAYENLRYQRAQKQLIDLSYQIENLASQQLLSETLTQVCTAVKAVTRANLVAIYPLLEGAELFDLENVACVGQDNVLHVKRTNQPGGFTKYVLASGTPTIAISDVLQHAIQYDGCTLAEHTFIKAERIRALISAPICGLRTGLARGILYLDYRSVQDFTDHDVQLAASFAQLAAVAIRNWRDTQGLRKAHEDEFHALSEVLTAALAYATDERKLIKTLLKKAHELLKLRKDVNFSVVLRDWQRLDSDPEPLDIRRQYYLNTDGNLSAPKLEKNIEKGVVGLALHTGQTQLASDVLAEEWVNKYDSHRPDTRAELDVPIHLNDRTIGVLNLESPTVNAFTAEHVGIFERLTSASALAFDNVRRQQHLHTILKAAAAMAEPIILEETLQAVLDAVRDAAPDLSVLTIWHKSPLTGDLVLGKYFGVTYEDIISRERPMENDVVRSVMTAQEPIWAEDITRNALLSQSAFVIREALRSSVAFQLRAQDKSVGVMFFSYRQFHTFTAEEHAIFPILAQIAAASINDALMLEKTDKEHKRLEAVVKIVDTIGSNLELDETLRRILQCLKGLYSDVAPCILIHDEINQTLNFTPAVREFYKIDDLVHAKLNRVPWDNSSLVGSLAIQSQKHQRKLMMNVDDVEHPLFKFKQQPNVQSLDFSTDQQPQYMRLLNDTKSQFTITLYSERYNKLLGVLALESSKPDRFDLDDEFTIWGIAKHIRFALERDRLAADMRFKDAVASATTWAADIAHDINRETGHIRNRTTWLKQEEKLEANGQHYIEEIEQSAQRLTEVLSYTQTYDPEKLEEIDLVGFLPKCIDEIVNKRGSDTVVNYFFKHSEQYIKTHPDILRRVVRHIVRNALEAMGWSDNQKLTVTTTALEQIWVEIQLEDNGSGIIDPRSRQMIFNAPIPSKDLGHGYGLLFARDAIEHIGGTIRLLPYEPDRGAVFAIRIPVVDTPSNLIQEIKYG